MEDVSVNVKITRRMRDEEEKRLGGVYFALRKSVSELEDGFHAP
jgi:hypothetical protein